MTTATTANMTNALEKALEDVKPTLVEFYAPWCPHCQRMMPIVEQLRAREGAKVNIIQIDGDTNTALMDKYHVESYPTWIMFRDGQEAWRDGGEKPLSELVDMCHRFE